MCAAHCETFFYYRAIMDNGSWNRIPDNDEHHTKAVRLSEKNIINECVEENTNSLYCSVEEKTTESKINGTGLDCQILTAIRTVILNHKFNKL